MAFAGCTLPGAPAPLFTVPDGMMSVGLGIHGEPGVRDVPLQRGSRARRALCSSRSWPSGPTGRGTRAVLIVNGLGTVKYEELFVLFRYVTDLLAADGVEVVSPLCGELVTSLDMAGVSVTLMWLDDELERLWNAPASTPAFTAATWRLDPARPARPTGVAAPDGHRRAGRRDGIAGLARGRRARGAQLFSRVREADRRAAPMSSAISMRSPATATTASACCAASTPRPSRAGTPIRASGSTSSCAAPERRGPIARAAPPARCGARRWRPWATP